MSGQETVQFTSSMNIQESIKVLEEALDLGMRNGLYDFTRCEKISQSLQTQYKIFEHLVNQLAECNQNILQANSVIEEYKNIITSRNTTIININSKLENSVSEIKRLEEENSDLRKDLNELCEEPEPEPEPKPEPKPKKTTEKKSGKQKCK